MNRSGLAIGGSEGGGTLCASVVLFLVAALSLARDRHQSRGRKKLLSMMFVHSFPHKAPSLPSPLGCHTVDGTKQSVGRRAYCLYIWSFPKSLAKIRQELSVHGAEITSHHPRLNKLFRSSVQIYKKHPE